jgi:hypothetical protein
MQLFFDLPLQLVELILIVYSKVMLNVIGHLVVGRCSFNTVLTRKKPINKNTLFMTCVSKSMEIFFPLKSYFVFCKL